MRRLWLSSERMVSLCAEETLKHLGRLVIGQCGTQAVVAKVDIIHKDSGLARRSFLDSAKLFWEDRLELVKILI